jgi:hypothetical protein
MDYVDLLLFGAGFQEKYNKEQKCHASFTPPYNSPESFFLILTSQIS